MQRPDSFLTVEILEALLLVPQCRDHADRCSRVLSDEARCFRIENGLRHTAANLAGFDEGEEELSGDELAQALTKYSASRFVSPSDNVEEVHYVLFGLHCLAVYATSFYLGADVWPLLEYLRADPSHRPNLTNFAGEAHRVHERIGRRVLRLVGRRDPLESIVMARLIVEDEEMPPSRAIKLRAVLTSHRPPIYAGVLDWYSLVCMASAAVYRTASGSVESTTLRRRCSVCNVRRCTVMSDCGHLVACSVCFRRCSSLSLKLSCKAGPACETFLYDDNSNVYLELPEQAPRFSAAPRGLQAFSAIRGVTKNSRRFASEPRSMAERRTASKYLMALKSNAAPGPMVVSRACVKYLMDPTVLTFSAEREEPRRRVVSALPAREFADKFERHSMLDLVMSAAPAPSVFGEGKCVVCLENAANVVYPACLHRCVCQDCEMDVYRESAKCPMCRAEVDVVYVEAH